MLQDTIDKRMDPLNYDTPDAKRVSIVSAAISDHSKPNRLVHHWVNTRHSARGANVTPLVKLLQRSHTVLGVCVYEKAAVNE